MNGKDVGALHRLACDLEDRLAETIQDGIALENRLDLQTLVDVARALLTALLACAERHSQSLRDRPAKLGPIARRLKEQSP